jgi:hypothetical protein
MSWLTVMGISHDAGFHALLPLWPVLMSFVLSFIYVGIYWNKLQYGNHPSPGRTHIQVCTIFSNSGQE